MVAKAQAALASGALDDLSDGAREVLFVMCKLADDNGIVCIDGDPAKVIGQHLNRAQRRRAQRRAHKHVR